MAHLDFKPGETIFCEGDESREAYYVVSGRVEITVVTPEGPRVLGRISRGEIFGEMGMVADRPRSATAIAVEATAVESFSEAVFEDYILSKPDRVRVFLSTLFERLRTTDALLQAEWRKREAGNGGAGAAVEAAAISVAHMPTEVGDPSSEEKSFRVQLRSMYHESGWSGEPVAEEITTFPFRIGRAFDDNGVALFARNDLAISDKMPYHVSRNHCEVEREGNSFFVRDRGSALGTNVNDVEIGMRAGEMTARLEIGENDLVLGTKDGPHHYVLSIEAI